jgi:hypothetical protein
MKTEQEIRTKLHEYDMKFFNLGKGDELTETYLVAKIEILTWVLNDK